MREYQLIESPTIFPAACVCGAQQGPMVDTFLERAEQRIYVCALCASRIARHFGFANPEVVAEYEARIEALTEALEEALAKRVVSLPDAMAMARQGSDRGELVHEVAAAEVIERGLHILAGREGISEEIAALPPAPVENPHLPDEYHKRVEELNDDEGQHS